MVECWKRKSALLASSGPEGSKVKRYNQEGVGTRRVLYCWEAPQQTALRSASEFSSNAPTFVGAIRRRQQNLTCETWSDVFW